MPVVLQLYHVSYICIVFMSAIRWRQHVSYPYNFHVSYPLALSCQLEVTRRRILFCKVVPISRAEWPSRPNVRFRFCARSISHCFQMFAKRFVPGIHLFRLSIELDKLFSCEGPNILVFSSEPLAYSSEDDNNNILYQVLIV